MKRKLERIRGLDQGVVKQLSANKVATIEELLSLQTVELTQQLGVGEEDAVALMMAVCQQVMPPVREVPKRFFLQSIRGMSSLFLPKCVARLKCVLFITI